MTTVDYSSECTREVFDREESFSQKEETITSINELKATAETLKKNTNYYLTMLF